MSKIQIPANLLMPGGSFGIVRAQGKTYVAPAWVEVPADTQYSDIEVVGMNDPLPVHEPTHVIVTGSTGKKYRVQFDSNGRASCECVGFTYHRRCKHIDQAITKK
jgi:hypothetical protein